MRHDKAVSNTSDLAFDKFAVPELDPSTHPVFDVGDVFAAERNLFRADRIMAFRELQKPAEFVRAFLLCGCGDCECGVFDGDCDCSGHRGVDLSDADMSRRFPAPGWRGNCCRKEVLAVFCRKA